MKLNMVDAINLALKQEMKKDSKVVVLGEDIGVDGGVFRVTEGLLDLYPDRVFDTPLAESGIVGTSIGLALGGMKPVCEIQFDGFTYPALDQLISHASRIRTRTRGKFGCQMVLRFPCSGGIKALEHHSESPETYFIHTPGLKVVMPSTPYDAKGLLISAIRDQDPVIFMEPKRVYRAIKEEVPEKEYTIPLGQAEIKKEGKDVTLISWGAMVRECQSAAAETEESCEVIDLRTLKPFDIDTILKSVKKTGRAVIVHEAPRTCGLGAELSAQLVEKALLDLKAPVQRVTGLDTVIPLAKLENYYLPNKQKIQKAVKDVMKF